MKIIGRKYDLGGLRVTRTPGQGAKTEDVYSGSAKAIQDLALQFDPARYETVMERNGHEAELRVSIAAPQPGAQPAATLEFRMQVNRIMKDLLEPSLGWDPLDQVTEEDRRIIRDAIRKPTPGTIPTFSSATADSLYKLFLAGAKARIVYQPVFYVIRTAPPGFNWPPEHYDNVGAIHTDAQMIADQGLSGLLNFELASIGYPEDPPAGYLKGWLKHCPYYDTSVGQRTTENIEFELGIWSELLHPAAS